MSIYTRYTMRTIDELPDVKIPDMTIKHVFEVAPYSTSRDHARLAELAQKRGIVCIIGDDDLREVAKTHYWNYGEDGGQAWEIGARGICYLWARTPEDFVRKCRTLDVEFFEPPLTL